MQGQFIGGQGVGSCGVQRGAGQNAAARLLHLHGPQRRCIRRRVPGGDDPQRLGQGVLALAVGVEPQRGALGGFQAVGAGTCVDGNAAHVGQHRVIQQTVQVVLLGGQIAFVKIALERHQHHALAGVAAVLGQQVGQFGAAEHRIGLAVGHVVPFQRHGAVHTVQRACQGVGSVGAVGSQDGGAVPGGAVGRLGKHAGGFHGVGLCLGQGVVLAGERYHSSFRRSQPGGECLDEVAPLVPGRPLQRRHGAIAQQGGQRVFAGPVAVQAAAQRQGVGVVGDVSPGGSCGQQRVAGHIQQAVAGGVIYQQQVGRAGVVRLGQRYPLGIGVGPGRRGQRRRRIDSQRLRRGGGSRLNGRGIFGGQHGGLYVGQRAPRQQQRGQCQRRSSFPSLHYAVFPHKWL